jgi:hypothetical protein
MNEMYVIIDVCVVYPTHSPLQEIIKADCLIFVPKAHSA